MLIHEEPELDISEIIVMDPDNTFYMRMGSMAMSSYHILQDHVLVIDRTLQPVSGSIVAFFHDGEFYIREYAPGKDKLLLKADSAENDVEVLDQQNWTCWGVVMLSLNPLLQPQHRIGRYAHVCAC